MTIDERLQYLLTSSESLHANLQELSALQAQQIEESKRLAADQIKHQRAVVAAMRAYLEAMEG